MARKQRSLLGIELHEDEIRVVEMRQGFGSPSLGATGVCPMPHGAVRDGVIVRSDAVAAALQRLIEQLNIGTSDAVIGVPASGVNVRALTLPPSPDNELAMLVDGDVRHFQVLRSD